MDIKELENFAADIRITTIEALAAFGQGHIGGCMSIADALAVLYGSELKHDPENPGWNERDRLIMSKGHAGPALISTLALRGFFPVEDTKTINADGTHFPGHVDRTKTPGVDMTCGSLGQGLSAGIGMAIGAKLDGIDNRTYVILGDGECDEGQVWEGVMLASHLKLNNLIVLVDNNKQQLDGYVKNVQYSGKMADKFAAFDWNVIEVNGHSAADIQSAIRIAKKERNAPTAIVLDTIKGYGANFAEGKEFNHSMAVSEETAKSAVAALNAKRGA